MDRTEIVNRLAELQVRIPNTVDELHDWEKQLEEIKRRDSSAAILGVISAILLFLPPLTLIGLPMLAICIFGSVSNDKLKKEAEEQVERRRERLESLREEQAKLQAELTLQG
jgi:hypothetical protein